MKRFASLLMLVMVVFALAIPVFAAGAQEPETRSGVTCNCGGWFEQFGEPYVRIVYGTKHPEMMCSHQNPQHMVCDRTEHKTTTYRCTSCGYTYNQTVETILNPDCMY